MLKVIYEPAGRAREYMPWAANLYDSCSHRCLYCYAPAALHKKPETWGLMPLPRVDIITKLTKDCAELKSKGEFHKVLLSFTSDIYQPINDQFQLARQAIEVLHFYGQSVAILTKGGYRALADLPLLGSGDEFAVTLTCTDDKLSRQWEPGAALPAERMDTLSGAHARGIYTWVSLEPVLYPEQSLEIIELTHEFVNHYKVGKLNWHSRAKSIDWGCYAQTVTALLDKLGARYYIKADLAKYLGESMGFWNNHGN